MEEQRKGANEEPEDEVEAHGGGKPKLSANIEPDTEGDEDEVEAHGGGKPKMA